MYIANSIPLFCATTTPRYTSITYDSAWNVKNEMPMGSVMWGIAGSGSAPKSTSNTLRLSHSQFVYLKNVSNPMLKATASVIRRRGESLAAPPDHARGGLQHRVAHVLQVHELAVGQPERVAGRLRRGSAAGDPPHHAAHR